MGLKPHLHLTPPEQSLNTHFCTLFCTFFMRFWATCIGRQRSSCTLFGCRASYVFLSCILAHLLCVLLYTNTHACLQILVCIFGTCRCECSLNLFIQWWRWAVFPPALNNLFAYAVWAPISAALILALMWWHLPRVGSWQPGLVGSGLKDAGHHSTWKTAGN